MSSADGPMVPTRTGSSALRPDAGSVSLKVFALLSATRERALHGPWLESRHGRDATRR